MKVKLDLDPTPNKALLIGILIALEAFLLPLYACLQGGNFPTVLELATWAVNALIQEVTYWFVFLKRGDNEESEPA